MKRRFVYLHTRLMIKEKNQIFCGDIPVFTKASLESPLTEDLSLPSDACFLYINEGDGHEMAQVPKVKAEKGTTILSTCGMTVGHIISQNMSGSMETIIVHFNIRLLKECFENEKPALWEELQSPINEYVVQTAAGKLVTSYFNGIDEFFLNKEATNDELIKLKLKEIIHLLLQSDNANSVRKIVNSLFSERTFTFKELVDSHIYTSASVENLSQLTGTSLATFKRKFKEIYNESPGKYVLQKKLDKVAEMIRITDEPISQIGYQLGFESPEHLSRSFKQYFKISPSQFRKRSEGNKTIS